MKTATISGQGAPRPETTFKFQIAGTYGPTHVNIPLEPGTAEEDLREYKALQHMRLLERADDLDDQAHVAKHKGLDAVGERLRDQAATLRSRASYEFSLPVPTPVARSGPKGIVALTNCATIIKADAKSLADETLAAMSKADILGADLEAIIDAAMQAIATQMLPGMLRDACVHEEYRLMTECMDRGDHLPIRDYFLREGLTPDQSGRNARQDVRMRIRPEVKR